VYLNLTKRFRDALGMHIREKYGLDIGIVTERPPEIEMGEAASPVSFELAKRLKRAPRQIAQEIASSLAPIPGIAKVEVAGGYLNAYFDRVNFLRDVQRQAGIAAAPDCAGKIIVEHTSINPNKAAHIGHVRNAVLGDTIARVLRHTGGAVQVQNYIDNTGVQVADVVIGFVHMEKKNLAQVREMAAQANFDYLCWDVYARAAHFLEADKTRAAALRGETLRTIEEGHGEIAEMGMVIANAIVSLHLRTMARLGIWYDLLARESEILHLHFWDAAFEQLKAAGAIRLAMSGKMAGCWIMPAKEKAGAGRVDVASTESIDANESAGSTADEDPNNQDKIIVRSNGTVTYVGKDIAYQLWKFGLLGKDFFYTKWPNAPGSHTLWSTANANGDPSAPNFGAPATTVYNVIDSRQAYLQDVVSEGLRALGYNREADNSIHFAYEIVALTPRCAAEMGYELSPEETKKPYVEVSGRKGFGVKADDLLDKLEAATLSEVQQRHADMDSEAQRQTAHKIAVGALRFFLLKFTRNATIAFDFKDALSFEGETGPYCQYAVVRIRGIRRKGTEAGATQMEVQRETVATLFSGPEGNALWELVVLAGSLDMAVDAAIKGQEPAFVAKFAFQLAQAFNLFYHHHHILSEADEQKRAFLLRLTELVETQLVRALDLLGIEAPEKM
jgi:arginyl-tRNA synthetase